MSYVHCHKCDRKLDFPSTEEIVKGKIECECGDFEYILESYHMVELITDMQKRIESLEQKTS